MRYQTAAEALRSVRTGAGLSQRQLALRAGTSQAAISRIERGEEEPTLGRLANLLAVVGVRSSLMLEPAATAGVEDELSHVERLREAASWNLVTTTLEIEAARARAAGHPATRRGR
jgi:transcriptional regulator with XRE-family HTH domain